MNFLEFANSQEIKQYFGKRYDKWQPELVAILEKKGLGANRIDDVQAQKQLLATVKFSWLGLLFVFYWAAYHDAKWWLPTVVSFSVLSVIDTALGGLIPATVFTVAPSVAYAMFGKAQIFAAKAEEMTRSGSLKPPSWWRVVQAIGILVVPGIIALLIFEPVFY